MERMRQDLCRSRQQTILPTRWPGVSAPLESGVATFQRSPRESQKCPHRTHIDERQHESGLFRLQTDAPMKWTERGVTACDRRIHSAEMMDLIRRPSYVRHYLANVAANTSSRRYGLTPAAGRLQRLSPPFIDGRYAPPSTPSSVSTSPVTPAVSFPLLASIWRRSPAG